MQEQRPVKACAWHLYGHTVPHAGDNPGSNRRCYASKAPPIARHMATIGKDELQQNTLQRQQCDGKPRFEAH
jgi:hypothetical protein